MATLDEVDQIDYNSSTKRWVNWWRECDEIEYEGLHIRKIGWSLLFGILSCYSVQNIVSVSGILQLVKKILNFRDTEGVEADYSW